MAHVVICTKCGKKFDRDSIQAVRTGARRYAHAACDPDNTDLVPLVVKEANDPDYIKLMDFIKELFGDTANYAQIKRQLKIYINDNHYSFSGILKSLIYFYRIKGNSIEKANGALGIVPFVYQDAYNYYYSLFLAQSQNENKDIKEITTKVKEVVIPPPKVILPKRFFNLDDEEVENDQ